MFNVQIHNKILCSIGCPISGQIRKPCAILESCTRTCDNMLNPISCLQTKICNSSRCECPNGTVVNDITKQCVKPENCPSVKTNKSKSSVNERL